MEAHRHRNSMMFDMNEIQDKTVDERKGCDKKQVKSFLSVITLAGVSLQDLCRIGKTKQNKFQLIHTTFTVENERNKV